MTFAEKLQALRERAGLSQAELAKASAVPVWTLRGYEQGRREPLWAVLFKLADALGVPVEEFRDCVAVATPSAPKQPAESTSRGKSLPLKRRKKGS